MRKIRWIIASCLFCVIWIAERAGPEELQERIHRIVYSHDDIVIFRSFLTGMKNEPQIIPVYQDVLMDIQSVEPYNDGFIVTVSDTNLKAKGSGVILYTGMTKEFDKMMTVYYDFEEVKVTYGHLKSIKQYPYIVVNRQDLLADLSKRKQFYIQIEKAGKVFSLEETKRWLEVK